MTVALFVYQQIYCRYLCPGECIIQDRGELCNKVANLLAKKFNCSIRVISAGRPQANGQAEAYVKNNTIMSKMASSSLLLLFILGKPGGIMQGSELQIDP